jgi:hypothetical protein
MKIHTETLKTIREQLECGDIAEIAKASGFKYQMVYKNVHATPKDGKDTVRINDRILTAMIEIVNQRNALTEKVNLLTK